MRLPHLRMRRGVFLLSGMVALGLTGCGNMPAAKPAARVGPLYWPALPEQPRFVYEAVLRDSDSLKRGGESSSLRQVLSGEASVKSGFQKPLAVAARRGRIYVSDSEGRKVVVFDVPRRRVFALGQRLEGELRKPAGIAVDRQGAVYVADVTARRVIAYDELGLYLRSYGDARLLDRPTGVAASAAGDRVYAIDAGGVDSADRHRVVVFDGDGRHVRTIGTRGGAPGEFNLPVDGAVGPDGTLYVLDAGNFRVQAFAPDGRFLRSFGRVGSGPGEFARPRGIAVDPVTGNVYVSDANFCNVQVFDPHGQLLIALGSRGSNDEPGRYALPAGVAVDETHRLYVVDQFFHKVEVLRALGDDEGRSIVQRAGS